MASHRQKKKKSAAAAKQAAVQYKGKNAPVRPAVPPKKVEEAPKPQDTVTKQENKPQQTAPKAESKPQKPEPLPSKPQKEATPKSEKRNETAKPKEKQKSKAQPSKSAKQAKKGGKSKPAPKKKVNRNVKLSKRITLKIEEFGVRKFAAIVLAVSVVIAAVCIIMWVTSSTFGIPDNAVIEYKGRNIASNITQTVLDDIDKQYEYADNMKRKGDKKAFRYYANDTLVFAAKNSYASLDLVNVVNNNCVLIATIVDEAGNVCYRSNGLIEGQRLTDIKIQEYPYGTYDMKLVVAAYETEPNPKNNEYKLIGVQSSDLTVQVGIEEETSDVQETENQN